VKIGVSGRSDMPRRVELAEEVVETWEKLTGQTPALAPDLADELGRDGGTPVAEMDCEVIVPVGGDGTILWTLMRNPDAQLLGVNDGELGYLTEVEPTEIAESLERLDAGDYFVERRSKLDVALNGERLGSCANEVVVKTPQPSKLLSFEVYAEDHRLEDVQADGIILATPTGSTSYSMSAGGPLVHPALEAVLFVPLAPFRVSQRPMVLPAASDVTLRLQDKGKEGVFALDGQDEHRMAPGDELVVTRSDDKARFVRFEPHFYSRIRELFG
jgi:NAD+ kinase